jgi:LysR family hydrogen peroxide-inducible transcriptional activator
MINLPTLKQLRYLAAVAEAGHFGRAAEACFVSQSTLSAGIQELEAILGATLIERTKRTVMLTPLGTDITARARRILSQAEDLAAAAAADHEPLSGLLRLGAIPTIGPYLLPRVMPALRRAHPRLRLYVREDQTARLIERLAGGDLDAVLLALPFGVGELETRIIGDDPFWVAFPPDHRFCAKKRVGADDLAAEDLLLLEDGHCLRDHALAACRLRDSATAGEFQATSLYTLTEMVAAGFGLTLLPGMAVESGLLRDCAVAVRRLAGPGARRRIGLAWRRSSPRGPEFERLAGILARPFEEPGDGGSPSTA